MNQNKGKGKMKWNYTCPNCYEWVSVDWVKRNQRFNCHKCNHNHIPPSPSQQYDAYVDTHNWPQEMEDVVLTLKGKLCTAPGCTKKYETLDHRVAFSNGGKTSIENLWPMCNDCNQSKGDKSYDLWISGY